jgi:hypothetical protein
MHQAMPEIHPKPCSCPRVLRLPAYLLKEKLEVALVVAVVVVVSSRPMVAEMLVVNPAAIVFVRGTVLLMHPSLSPDSLA